FAAPQGCSILTGTQALNYDRGRYYEQNINGSWVRDFKDDSGHADRPRAFVVLAWRRVIAKGGRKSSTMRKLMKTAVDSKSLILDEHPTPQDLLDIGRGFGNFNPDALQRYSLPTYGGDDQNLHLDTTKS